MHRSNELNLPFFFFLSENLRREIQKLVNKIIYRILMHRSNEFNLPFSSVPSSSLLCVLVELLLLLQPLINWVGSFLAGCSFILFGLPSSLLCVLVELLLLLPPLFDCNDLFVSLSSIILFCCWVWIGSGCGCICFC